MPLIPALDWALFVLALLLTCFSAAIASGALNIGTQTPASAAQHTPNGLGVDPAPTRLASQALSQIRDVYDALPANTRLTAFSWTPEGVRISAGGAPEAVRAALQNANIVNVEVIDGRVAHDGGSAQE